MIQSENFLYFNLTLIFYLPPINGPNCGNRALVITGVKNEEDQATNEEENERCIAVYHLPAVKDNEKIKVTFFGEKSTAGKKGVVFLLSYTTYYTF